MTPRSFKRILFALGAAACGAALPLPAVAQDDSRSDRRALEAFYDATGGPRWENRTNWKTDAPLGDWHGVMADEKGRVFELQLSDNGLTGTLPPVLGQFQSLQWLYLRGNALTGPIPPELARLASLEVLSLASNELNGPIPAWLGRLANLKQVGLWNNDLTGPIPAELGRLTRLESLELIRNELTGPIPAELGNLANLELLGLANNDLNGPLPAELGNLARLKSLDLSYNWELSGPLPAGLRQLPLDSLHFYVTGACAPDGWREWLATIDSLGRMCSAETDATIDVAIFYTPAAREQAGGADAIEAAIDLMVAETNDAYLASGVQHRLAVVARSEVSYVEAEFDLERLADPSDGHLDEVHAVRDRTGADLVHLIVGNYGGLCGQAQLAAPFGITYHVCGGLTFAHEIGHNLGLYHDRFQAQVNESGAFSTPAYGYVNPRMFETGAPASSRWLTIMAYHRECQLGDFICATLPRFSNPRQRHLCDPLGVAHGVGGSALGGPADAAAVLGATGPVVAAWRDRPPDAANRPPVVLAKLPDRTLAAAGDTRVVEVAQAFDDPDGDTLAYTASSSAPRVARASASGARVRLTAVGMGAATVRVTATDTGGLSVSQLFSVAVEADGGTDSLGGGHPDRRTLEALFDATGGVGWTSRSNWRTAAPLDQWFGVTTDGAGRVTELDLSQNRLTGSIPSELGELGSLKVLDLSLNRLTGAIPSALGGLHNLESLYLQGNRLTGAVVPELARLANLVELRLENNALTGAIPAALGNLAKLQQLVLNENALIGTIPGELGRLGQLNWLELSRNDLTGPIPAELGRLNLRGGVSLSHNWGLSGPLPAGWERSEVEHVDVFVTRTCAPAAWQAWLETIQYFGSLCGAGPATIDMAVAYTPAARREAGGAAGIEAEIDLMISTTNEVFATSGVRQRVALAGRSEVAYTETFGGTDLERLVDPSDGHLDAVHAFRDRTGADLAHLIVSGAYDVCGIAQQPEPYKDPGAFGITLLECGGLTFAHELGHNLGLRHDRFQVQVNERGAFSHPAYGYVNQRALEADTPPARHWGTIMSYPASCRRFDTTCLALPRFSNPRQRFGGDPLGVAHGAGGSLLTGAADAAAVLDATGPAVAAWRDRPDGHNRPPAAVGTLPAWTLGLNGTLEIDVSPAFMDPDGDALTYGVSSSASGVVTARAAGNRVTLTAIAVGRATITVTATDRGRLRATQSFLVEVTAGGGASFTDDPIRPGRTPVRAIHFMELRARIDALRSVARLPSFRWTDPVLRAGVTPVRLVHLLELRSALAGAYAAAGRPALRWTDAAPVAGTTPIRAAHLTELRAAVLALE